MKTIILPGFSPHNLDWAVEVKKSLGKDTFIHKWRHWERGGGIKTKYELETILKIIGKNKVNILAKSVGTRVTFKLLTLIPEKINKVILCGIPTVSVANLVMAKSALLNFNSNKVVVFQNQKDPFASFSKVKNFMSKVDPKIKVMKGERKDHHYPFYEDFKSIIK